MVSTFVLHFANVTDCVSDRSFLGEVDFALNPVLN